MKLVESLKKPGNHPMLRMKKEVKLGKAKATCKHLGGELSVVKDAVCEKEEHFKRLDSVNKSLYVAMKVKNSYAARCFGCQRSLRGRREDKRMFAWIGTRV